MPSSPSQELARGDACFGSSTSSQSSGATRDLAEECRFLLGTQLMFLKKEKDPTSEWIRADGSVRCHH